MLALTDIDVRYGHVQALRGVSLSVAAGGIFAVLGANGAGKTTLIRSILGLVPHRGRIDFDGSRLDGVPTFQRVARGMALVPEGRKLFSRFSVAENLMIGAFLRRDRAEVRRDAEAIVEKFPALRARYRALAGTLSGGEGQMLAIGRALMARPRLLLLDEPSVGLMPRAVTEIFNLIEQIPGSGVTVLLVEQNVRQALRIAQHVAVLELGHLVLQGPAHELVSDPRIKDAYLGV